MKKILVLTLILTLIGIEVKANVVKLKEEIEIDQSQIFLKDVATFEQVDGDLLERLQNLKIGSSPLPGRTRKIDYRYIQGRIATLGKEGRALEVIGPKKVEVTTSFQRLDPDRVVEACRDYILSKVEKMDGEFKVELTRPPREFILPSGEVEIEVIEGKSSPLMGPVYIETRISVDQKKCRRLRTGFNIQRFQKVVSAARTLNQHQIISKEDLIEEMAETTGLVHQQPFSEADSLVGKRVKRPIKEGTILTSDMVEVPPLVKRGSIVTLKSEIGNVQAWAMGKALRDGREGERIRIRNLSSKETIEGVVHSSNLVIIK